MQNMRKGVQVYTVREFIGTQEGYEQSLRKIREIGYDSVQTYGWKVPDAEHKAFLEELGLTTESVGGDYEEMLRDPAAIKKAIETAHFYGTDLVSVGTIGLIKAVNSFDPAKNIKLATYASRCIENEILMYLRRLVRVRNEVSFDEPLNTDWEGNELLLSDILGTDSDVVYKDIETGVEKELLRGALRRLPERDRRIMTMRFGLDGKEEMTQKDVADVLGISQSYISRLEKKIIARLKSEIGKLV